jgi:hypothetical protein
LVNDNLDQDQKHFNLLATFLKETLADVDACKSSLETKNKIYEKFNYLQNLNLRDLKYDEKKLMQYQIISHEIKELDKKSKYLF